MHPENTDINEAKKAFRQKFAANLNAALDQAGSIPAGYGRVVAVAELFKISQTTAAIWLKGDGVPELHRLPDIARLLGTTLEQLVYGSDFVDTHSIVDERYVPISLIDSEDHDITGGHVLYTLPETLRFLRLPNDVQMLLIDNDDMIPTLNKGDVVLYDPRVQKVQTNGLFVLGVDGRYIVRRIQRSSIKRTIRLSCDNKTLEDENIAEEDLNDHEKSTGISVCGYVVGQLTLSQ